jgi:hypothetical protein
MKKYVVQFSETTLNNVANLSRISKLQGFFVVLACATIGSYFIIQSRAAVTCDLAATTSNFNTQVTAATAGQTICLASGDYGTWQGAIKSGAGITIRPANGANVSMALNFTCGGGTCNTKKVSNITIDGTGAGPASGESGPGSTNGVGVIPGPAPAMQITDINMEGQTSGYTTPSANQPTNVTIRNVALTGWMTYRGIGDAVAGGANNVIEHSDIDNSIGFNGANNGRIRLNYSGAASFGMSGLTIQYNKIGNTTADGIHTGTALKVIGNEVYNICNGTVNHPDHIQFEAADAPGTLVQGNYVHAPGGSCDTQGITSFDYAIKGVTIENNVVNIDRNFDAGIEVSHAENVVIRHNTVLDADGTGDTILVRDVPTHAGYQASVNIQVYDNVASVSESLANPSALTRSDHNFAVASQTLIGGTMPSSYAGFALANNSSGKNAASDGTDAGININSGGTTPTPPPPPPSDTTPPTVSLTAPTAGSTVSGASVTLSATAADNVAVSGVQFKVDGNNVGSEDTASPFSIAWDSRTATNGSHTITAVARDAAGNSTTSSSVSVTTNNATSCSTSSSSWANNSFASQNVSFTFDFDATPSATNIDSVTGLSSAAAGAFTDLAAAVRFNNTGTIDARNGGAYAADTALSYVAGTSYHFTLTVNVTNHTYTVVVTPAGGSATTVATNYAFRTEQASVASLANWATNSTTGTQTTCGVTVAAVAAGPKAGDINGDNSVNITDLSLLLSSYGQSTTQCVTNNAFKCDLSSPADNTVNIFDLSILLSNYGK